MQNDVIVCNFAAILKNFQQFNLYRTYILYIYMPYTRIVLSYSVSVRKGRRGGGYLP